MISDLSRLPNRPDWNRRRDNRRSVWPANRATTIVPLLQSTLNAVDAVTPVFQIGTDAVTSVLQIGTDAVTSVLQIGSVAVTPVFQIGSDSRRNGTEAVFRRILVGDHY